VCVVGWCERRNLNCRSEWFSVCGLAYQPKLGSKTCTGRDKHLKNNKIVTDNVTDKDRNITWA
jgi:hypothetical protein